MRLWTAALVARVGEDAGQRVEAGDRAEVDDRGRAAVIDEVLAEDLAGAEDGGEVGVDDALEFLLGDVEERGGGVDAGAVDEDVDLAGALEHGVEQVLERLARGDVDRHEVALAAVGFDFVEAFLGLFADAADRARLRRRRGRGPTAMVPQSSPVPPMTTAVLSREVEEVFEERMRSAWREIRHEAWRGQAE